MVYRFGYAVPRPNRLKRSEQQTKGLDHTETSVCSQSVRKMVIYSKKTQVFTSSENIWMEAPAWFSRRGQGWGLRYKLWIWPLTPPECQAWIRARSGSLIWGEKSGQCIWDAERGQPVIHSFQDNTDCSDSHVVNISVSVVAQLKAGLCTTGVLLWR